MALSVKDQAVTKADYILTDLLSEIADIEFLIRAGKFEKAKNTKFWSAEIDKRKNRLENQLKFAEQAMAGHDWPQTLTDTFKLAKKRKSVTKAQLTKVQSKLKL